VDLERERLGGEKERERKRYIYITDRM